VKALVDRGWAQRLMLGHDESPAPVLAGETSPPREGPSPYLFLSTVAIPGLRADGVSDDAIDTMLRDVPRRFLSGETM
jgi:phosphotriesterase-related protein